MSKEILKNDWEPLLKEEFLKPYYTKLRGFLKEEYSVHTVYPNMEDIFNALHFTPFHEVKVVMLGQDPYHGPDQAHGLSFSVKPDVTVPPSLRNIFKEMKDDIGSPMPDDGYLAGWAEQGVLLLNTVLTVRKGQAHSHQGMGWEQFTDHIIDVLNEKDRPVIYVLWGRAAQDKQALIDMNKHYVIKAPHPSPLSAHRGFFGSKPFSKINQLLRQIRQESIDWEAVNQT